MASGIHAVVVMGVTACGKSTVAEAVAGRIGGRHIEGDLFHSAANINKMRAGVALNDADRSGWLEQLGMLLAEAVAAGERPVLSCSALKRRYRDRCPLWGSCFSTSVKLRCVVERVCAPATSWPGDWSAVSLPPWSARMTKPVFWSLMQPCQSMRSAAV